MKRYFILIILAVITTVACTDRDDDITTVNIRIQNSTKILFQEVRVAGADTVYENIAVGDFSNYLEYGEAFEEMSLTIMADSTSFSYTPETAFTDSLPIGFYTYELSLDEANQLNLKFKID